MQLWEVILYKQDVIRAGAGSLRDPHRLPVLVLAESAGEAEAGALAMEPTWSVYDVGLARPHLLRIIYRDKTTWREV